MSYFHRLLALFWALAGNLQGPGSAICAAQLDLTGQIALKNGRVFGFKHFGVPVLPGVHLILKPRPEALFR
jgi:hypothetical protein